MLMELLALATLAERRAELAKCCLAEEALRGSPTRRWMSRLFGPWFQTRASRARSVRSASGHSLSMME